jgi:hypothetical protein
VTASSRCRICKESLDGAASPIVCDTGRNELGIVDMPPARRPVAPCGKCRGTKIVRVIPRDHTVRVTSTNYMKGVVLPMRLTIMPTTTRGLLSSHEYADSPEPSSGRGMLEAYVCRGCGFVEWYCSDPENIPIGPEFMTEELDAGDGGPYR